MPTLGLQRPMDFPGIHPSIHLKHFSVVIAILWLNDKAVSSLLNKTGWLQIFGIMFNHIASIISWDLKKETVIWVRLKRNNKKRCIMEPQ